MKPIEYLVVELRDCGVDRIDLQSELDNYGFDRWEFVEWSYSNGPGPHTRRAIFKRDRR